jgi:PAS domain S-box-containing protein
MLTGRSARRARESLRLILRQVPGVVWATDRALQLTYVHGRTGRLAPDDAKRLIGTSLYAFVGTDDPSEPAVAHHLAALNGQRQMFDYRREGRTFQVQIDPLQDETSAVVGCVGAAVDVTDLRDTRDRLAQSQARLAEAQRLAHIGSFEWDVAADSVTWSGEMGRISGSSPGEAVAPLEAFLAHVHQDDASRVRTTLLNASRRVGPLDYEHRVLRPDGSVRTLHTVGDVVTDPAGAVARVVGSCWDVTTQHETARQLERSIHLLEATLDATADGILVVDRDGGIVAHNQRLLALWHVPPSRLERGVDDQLLTYAASQLDDPEAFLTSGRDLNTSPGAEVFDLLWFRDGRVFERHSLPQIVAGEAVGRVWSFRDVTKREHLLQRTTFLSDATRLLSSLDLDSALQGVARLAVSYLGEACVVDLLAGGSPRRVAAAGGDADVPLNPSLHPAVVAGHPLVYAAGSRSHLAVPLFARDDVVGAVTLVARAGQRYQAEDLDLVSELGRRMGLSIDNARLYEAAQEAIGGRDQFMAIAAHEIRGPLTSAQLAAQGLSRGSLTGADARKALEVIQRETKRLARFVDDLLDLNRIRTGQLSFHLAAVDLGSVVRDLVSRLSEDAARVHAKIELSTQGHLVGHWDRVRLEQVVGNLLQNAIKFGEGRPIELAVTEADDAVRFICADHGVGIPSAMLGRIFDPYHRAVDARHYGGLGLGLHIAKTIVTGLGGTIAVESQPGQGATFTVTLPRDSRAASS